MDAEATDKLPPAPARAAGDRTFRAHPEWARGEPGYYKKKEIRKQSNFIYRMTFAGNGEGKQGGQKNQAFGRGLLKA